MNTSEAVQRLNSQLPLKARQAQLSETYRQLHKFILKTLVTEGRAPNRDELSDKLDGDVGTFLEKVGQDDLVVLDENRKQAVGAYPVTTEKTPHIIKINDRTIYAMCALDAMSVAPMFDIEVEIESTCRVTKTPIYIHMRGSQILAAHPSPDIQVGVRWQMPTGAAAHSMCMEMVFLKDQDVAATWQGGDTENTSIFNLEEAVAFGSAFFIPLLD